jgi:hypothetical protein
LFSVSFGGISWILEGEILNLQILQRPSSINSPKQTLRILAPGAASDPFETLRACQGDQEILSKHISMLFSVASAITNAEVDSPKMLKAGCAS